MHGTSVKIK